MGDLGGVVVRDVTSAGCEDIVEVLFFPNGNSVCWSANSDVVLLDLLALGVGGVHKESKGSEEPGEKLAELHGNEEEVVEDATLVVKGKVSQPDEPV